MQILIVDDNKTNRVVLRKYCELSGNHHIDCASDGEEAISLSSCRNYDLVFMDYHMPTMDGLAATAVLRAKARESDRSPVIILATANSAKEIIDAGYTAGADGYLAKPVNSGAVSELVNKTARDVLIRETRAARSDEFENESKAAATIIRRLTRQDELEQLAWFWSVAKPCNGIISGDCICAGVSGAGNNRGFLADNMGHGMSAALINVVLYDIFRTTLALSLPDAYLAVNAKLNDVLPTGIYTCGALFEVVNNELHVINAGLPPVVAGVHEAKSTELPMGIAAISTPPVPVVLSLARGAWLYTDGLSDTIAVKPAWFNESPLDKSDFESLLEILAAGDDVTVLKVNAVP